MTIRQRHGTILRLHRFDMINLAGVWAVPNNDSISRCKVQLLDTARPSTPLLNKLGVGLIKSVVRPILPHILLEGSVVVEAQITLRRQRSQLPVLFPRLARILQVLSDFCDCTPHSLAVSKLVVDILPVHLLLGAAGCLALSLGSSLYELLHRGYGPIVDQDSVLICRFSTLRMRGDVAGAVGSGEAR